MSFDPTLNGGTRLPQPGSLEYINRPNPVEPSTLSHGNFEGSARELDRTTNEQLHPFLLGNRLRRDIIPDTSRTVRHQGHQTSGVSIADVLNDDDSSGQPREHTPHRRDIDQAIFTLPKLPVKKGTKRHRVPPVLQGLHQPPPDARLLPSINTEDVQTFLSRNNKPIAGPEVVQEAPPVIAQEVPAEVSQTTSEKRIPQRNKWTDQETEDLLKGVAKFGIGSWKKILLCPDYHFHRRTAVDLKDRFRVCSRNKAKKKPGSSKPASVTKTSKSAESIPIRAAPESSPKEPQADENAQTDGETVEGNLWKARRRPRRPFTKEEDDALLDGFQHYGASWVSILKHPIFQENSRVPTDLRDRFRTKYPETYAEAGLASRPSVPKPATRSQPTRQDPNQPETPAKVAGPSTNPAPTSDEPRSNPASTERLERSNLRTGPIYGLHFPSLGDDMLSNFGFPEEEGPIVLDRSILTYSNRDTLPQMNETPSFPGIDPLVTLKLPRPGQF